MLVDWAGQTMKYTPAGGEERTVYVFVAVLPCSSLVYTQVFGDMKIESWVDGHTEAFEYYGCHSGEKTPPGNAQGIEAEIPQALPQVKPRNWSGKPGQARRD
jgi:transposase